MEARQGRDRANRPGSVHDSLAAKRHALPLVKKMIHIFTRETPEVGNLLSLL